MASSSTERPSSSSTFKSQWSYDVFLSFSGEDTRTTFTDHLYSALNRCNIGTFRDDEELPRGGEIKPELFRAIEESRIAIIIFSKNYASSKWCLEELVHIMKCKEGKEQRSVIPIFYHVEPTKVRNQTGIYGDAFTHHVGNADEEKIREWKSALAKAGYLAGYEANKYRYESELVDDIIKEIHRRLPKLLYLDPNIVGMNSRLEKLMSLLEIESDKVHMIGVYGFGGIGKTTIINALHNEILHKFESISYLANVREESTQYSGLLKLQQQLLDDTLMTKGRIALKNLTEGIKAISEKLSSTKVLIFLDDVDELKQLEHLIGGHGWFGLGSRIVITTRNKGLVTRRVDATYEVDKLNYKEAHLLFCRYAFKQDRPKEGYDSLCHHAVQYADGIPLVLKRLGSQLSGKGQHDWTIELTKLKEVPNMEIVKELNISFHELDDTVMNIFLDIACFFKGHDRQRVSRILDRFRCHAESGINFLLGRCFITISKTNTINMHGLLAQMGKEKVDIEDRREPGNRSRLWRRKDIHRVLKKEKEMGTQKVEGIFLNEYTTKQMRFTGEAFQRMNRLKLLEVNHNRVRLFKDFAFPKDGLTYLYWDRYPLESLPSNFHMRNLVELNLKNSKIKQLWKENMLLGSLRRIDVSGSQQLTELPDISSVPNLEDLILSGCVSLGSLPGNIYELEHLLTLDCNDCSKLTSFPKIKCNIGKLGEPSSDQTGLSLLSGLHSDQFHNCLSSLKELSLRSCNLKEGGALNHIFHLSSLKVLNLSWFNSKEGGILSYIVVRIGQLSNLRALYLSHCKKLPQIPQLPSSLRLLDAHSLHGIPLPPMHSLVNCLKSANQDLKCKSSSNEVLLTGSEYTGHGICIVFPGSSGIPEWIKNQEEGSSIRINLPQNWYENNDFLGVAICYVYVPLDECEYISENDSAHTSEMESDDGSAYESENESGDEPLNESEDLLEAESSFFAKLACQLKMDESVQDLRFGTTCKCYHFGGVSEQMWLIFYPKVAIQKSCGSNQFTSLTASFLGSYSNFKVIKCGLQPIYAQDPMVQTADVDVSCLECQRNVEYRNLCFKGQTINQLPIEYPSEVETLCLRDCKNLESLPTSICELKSLKSLVCSNCSQLQCFPESLENMGNLRELHLNGTAIKKLPSSIDYMNKLEVLNLESCQNLETLPESICNLCSLEVLHVSHCSKLHKWPQNLGTLKSLKLLYACGLNSTCCRLLSLSGLCSLKSLFLSQSKQMEGAILSDICCLYSLEVLDLCFCNIDEGGIPTEICYLSSLQQLLLMGNLFRSIPSGINQLSMLRLLDLSHCPELLQIPELPSSLRVLDVHECTRLDTSSGLLWSSLFKCFESVIQDLECGIYVREKCFRQGVSVIISGSSGIPKWISHHKKGAKVVAKLPQNWYKNNDFLGFVLYCVYDPLDNESEERLENDATYFKYGLTLRGHELQLVDGLSFYFSGNCCNAVPKMWMIYYPKVAIKKKYHSNKWGQLEASFCGYLHGKAMKVEECGIHLIYAHDHDQNHDKAMIPTICWKCQQDVQSQRQLCLKGNAINELPTTGCRLKLDSLCLWECKICTSLPSSSICELKSLTALFCSGSSQLRSFPEILQDVENLRELHLEGTAIEELPATIQHLKGLQCLCLRECKSLKSLPSSICELKSLTILFCSGCSQLNSFPEILVDVENLRQLHLDGTAIEELPASIQHLKGLQYLNLKDCYKLVSLPESICNLSSLKFLNVSFCTKLEKFPENLRSLQCLEALSASGLNLSMHYFSSIPAGIIQLSKLRVFDLSHCQRLLQVPELPASLRVLEVHSCSCLETLSSPSSLLGFSLFKCFKSTIEEFECGSYWNKAIRVVISGNNGIPEWISQQKKGSQITIELPMDWYRNNDFLGFALYSVFIPMVYDGLNCELNFCGDQSECCHVDDVWFLCCQICGESSQMCVTYYPKVAIDNQYWSNKWRRLKASFHGFDGKPVEVKECGFHLLYTPNVISKNIPQHTNTDAERSCDNTEATKHNHQKMIEYNDEQRSCDTRSAAEDTNTNAQTSYDYSQCTELSDSAMETTTQNINSDVDAQDDEEDHMHNWLELLCKFVQWICCRRY